jgi:Fe2+ transport system protein FeoA
MIQKLRLILNNGDYHWRIATHSPDFDWMITLDKLEPGQSGEIARVEGCDGISCRLREMGFVPGESVRFLCAAPLGDPLNCVIQGSRIALRGREAARIRLVDSVTASVAPAAGIAQEDRFFSPVADCNSAHPASA